VISIKLRLPRHAVCWPPLAKEIGELKYVLKGHVLNAGCGIPTGERDIRALVDGTLTNLDVFEHESIDVVAPLDSLPFDDETFDTVFCNAVLEHVRAPGAVLSEAFRVTKPGGHLYLSVPFLQPEHLTPTDYQRYTLDGLVNLVRTAGFDIEQTSGLHNVYSTIGWIIEEWLNSRDSLRNSLLRLVLFPVLKHFSRTSTEYVHCIASGYRLIARKPGAQPGRDAGKAGT
jgi:SAM-dependent methyltransferase